MEDLALLERLLAGDEAAFRELVAAHHGYLLAVARYYAGPDRAEDIVQETWLAVLRGLERFEGRSSLRTWLARICANRARSIARRESRQVPAGDPQSPSVPAARFDERGVWRDPPAPFADTLVERLGRADLVEAVTASIAALGEPSRSVVTLRDVEGLSTEEVAEMTGLSPGNVRVVLHRARARIRAAVEDAMKEAR